MDGEKISAAGTKKWDSICSQPLLPLGDSGEYNDFLLKLIVPGPVHLFPSCNELLNFLVKTQMPELKQLLAALIGVKVHEYQGKIGNYQGPEIHKILRNLYMMDTKRIMFYHTLSAFKEVAHSVFSTELTADWRERLHDLKLWVSRLASDQDMPVTPKLHVLIFHVDQYVDITGRLLGKEGEAPGEAIHHVWRRLLSNLGDPPKDNKSEAFVQFIFRAMLIFNANNI